MQQLGASGGRRAGSGKRNGTGYRVRQLCGSFLVATAAGPFCPAVASAAEPLPLPGVDFSLKASLRRGGSLDIAHSQGKMRVEMTRPNIPGSIISIIDMKARRMVIRTPNLPNMALEMELPPEYALGAVSGTGSKTGTDEVVGETCNLWQADAPTAAQTAATIGPTVACITPDGIALRTEVEIKGKKQTLFQATELQRGPQDPKLFALPSGVHVVKVPRGKIGAALGLGAPDPAPAAPPAKP